MSTPSLPLPYTGVWHVSDVIYRAFRAAGIIKRAQTGPSPEQAQEGLQYINQITDQWSARKPFAWTTTFTLYTLSPNHQPHLIGPGLTAPDFGAVQRPQRIESAELVLTGNGAPNPAPNPPSNPAGAINTNVDLPLNIRDSAWWASESVKGIATNTPTDLYYEKDFDNGQLWLWPIPSYAYGLRLETWVLLQQFQSIGSKFAASAGYFNALAFTLAKSLLGPFDAPMPPELPDLLRDAMKAIQSSNQNSPRITSADWGTRSSPRADFNYVSGTLPTGPQI